MLAQTLLIVAATIGPVLGLNLTSPERDQQWRCGEREKVAWTDAPGGQLTFQLQILNKAQKLFYDIHAGDFDSGAGSLSYRPTERDVEVAAWAGTYLRVLGCDGNELVLSDRFDIRAEE